ncbi:M14 family metallopeptidase [Robiginitalea sp. M366]|uniref:M14 family metallopeptidase n=1 Tax=Robiginitalea aestuariiviva TaxID=3036903 RepID=UPI00240DD7C4|nr:M14 family metallopeptidase [Robiginitalea aestuariiviva]MDG1570738.1 M14 family metallopeptidase [Robiginitalea aestuariiviva]
MKWLPGLLLLTALLLTSCEQRVESEKEEYPTPFETGNGNTSATYQEVLDFYIHLAREFPQVNLQTLGMTDSQHPLHLVTFNPEGNFNFQRLGPEKTVLLVLNGIHPGEPDGIDASMMLMRDLATGALEAPENIVVAMVPVYNVGGALQRNSATRANQNGPEQYGFRGNARNYDLNRDFIKMDTHNARSFAEIFHMVQPDFFLDTHVSNGADYTYALTHLFTQYQKLGGPLGAYQEEVLRPALEAALKERDWDITPYVNVFNRPPESGFSQFMDSPRYSTGYTTLWNVPGMMLETHMLKPYSTRVEGTYAVLETTLQLMAEHGPRLSKLREASAAYWEGAAYYPLAWAVDSLHYQELPFKGYKARWIPSRVTGQERLQYDREQPVDTVLAYYNNFRATDSVRIPRAYLMPLQWEGIRERLDWNHIQYSTLEADTVMQVTAYRIANYQTYNRPYEGHYPHYATAVSPDTLEVAFREGDLYIPTAQPGLRYLLETLEPQGVDSFFNWNFFDPILQRKEGYSPYVFEDEAASLLAADSTLRKAFEARKASDAAFAGSAGAQLNWIYMHSPHYEPAHNRYPVYRLE